MPPKVKDAKGKVFFKTGAQIKDLIPASCKNAPRETRPYKFPEGVQPPLKVSEFEPIIDPEEWPSEDLVKNYDFGMDASKPYTDQFNEWPTELGTNNQRVIIWRRPREYLRPAYSKEENWSAPRLLPSQTTSKEQQMVLLKEDTYSTSVETKSQIDELTKQIEEQLCVCETFEREELPEETDRRRKEMIEKITQQQAKEKKKAPKRPEEMVEEGSIMIKDVRLTDVNIVIDNLGPDGRWVGSQLQVIKDRDVRDIISGLPLWTKIYPQVDGAPVYNPSGKYWIRLYYMGKERKIEIDDRMPCNIGIPLLPQSAVPQQLWAMLISKAILKLLSFQRSQQSSRPIYGDGFVVYSLTGMMSEIIEISSMNAKELALLNEMVLDTKRKDYFITVYNPLKYVAKTTTNTQKKQSRTYQHDIIRHAGRLTDNIDPEVFSNGNKNADNEFATEEFDEDQENDNQPFVIKPLEHSLIRYRRRRSAQELPALNLQETYIIGGFSYSLVELFQNELFNMVYVQKRSDREIRLRQEYYEICRANIHKMSKEEKLEHRRRKKEIRERLNEEDKRRIELITQTTPYRIMRIKNGAIGTKPINVYCPFSALEIYIAKKCIANKLSKPPNYDVPEIRGDDKSVISSTVKNHQLQQDDSFQVKPLEDFTSLATPIEPIRREPGGIWVLEKDFLQLFKYLQVFYDPIKWQNQQVIQVPNNPDNEVATYENMEMIVVEQNSESEDPIKLLIGFQAKYASFENVERTIKPFSMLQRWDMEQFESVKDYKILDGYTSAQMLTLENKNNIFRLNVFSPLSYTLWISSTNPIRFTSIYDYLMEYEGYKPRNYSIDYPSLLPKKYFTFFRFKVCYVEGKRDSSSFVFRIKSSIDNYMFKNMRLKLCEVPTDSQYMLQTLEGVHKNLYETVYMLQGTQRIPIRKGTTYYFKMEGQTSYAIQEGTLQVDFLTNDDIINIDLLEQVEPLKYIDRYIPTKYGIIFKEQEKIFVNDPTVASFFIRLTEVAKTQEIQQITDKKGAPIKGAKAPETTEIVELEMHHRRRIKLELLCNDKPIVYSVGCNQAVLSCCGLNKESSFVIQCSFDLREWPEAGELSPDTENIHWVLSVLSTESIAVVHDTTKEDRERAIRKFWEDQEPGRSDKAKKSRLKFHLLQKQMREEDLTEEELTILNAPRISRKQREEDSKQAQVVQKGGKVSKKDEKKVAKAGKKEDNPLEQVTQAARVFPKSQDHTTNDIKDLLAHLEKGRLIEEYAVHAGLINVRTDMQKNEIMEGRLMAKEEAVAIISRNMQMREELKLQQKDSRDSFHHEHTTWRQVIKDNLSDFNMKKEQLKQEMNNRIRKEREITEICRQEKPSITAEELEKLLNEAKDTIPNINSQLIKIAMLVLKNIKIQSIQERLFNALQNYDIEILKNLMDSIEQNQIEGIDQDSLSKAEEMLDEANGNPNWLAEKQADQKKQSKKGKK